MLQDEQQIIDALGIADWPEEKRKPAVIEATMRIGTALLGSLNEQQDNEYTAIINDDQAVIDAWLEQNVPDYKQNPAYQEMEATYESDPEHNNPAKLFATIAWMQTNIPDLQERIEKTLADYKQELAA